MMTQWINEIKDGQRIKGRYLITNVSKGVTSNNSTYLTISFQDKTGSIDGKLWDVAPTDIEVFAVGNIVNLDADVLNYRGNLQLKIISAAIVDTPIDPSCFTMAAPVPVAEMERQLEAVLNGIEHGQIKLLVTTLIKNHYPQFITYPAAVRNHHEYASGLLYHTLSMVRLGEAILPHYPGLNRDMLIAGILIHDLGKTVELSGPIIPKYTVTGKLIGHITLMTSEILNLVKELGVDEEVGTLLAHMVISHHGKQEFGSPIIPMTKEALLLSMIDDMDAKLVMAEKALEGVEPGDFSSRVYALDDRSLYQPKFNKK
ncbi:MAG TPA: HD domain-containing protein [Bacilli bacterium]|nr:HD domain-containing protein [Bacilli bacterium]